MTIPSSFPTHWRQALDARDINAISFHDEADAIAFFGATSNRGCFLALSDSQKSNVADLRSRFPDESLQATLNAHARERKAEADEVAPRYIGAYAGKAAPTIEQLQPELDAIDAEIAKMPRADPWADVIERVNAGFNAMAKQVYAARNRKGA